MASMGALSSVARMPFPKALQKQCMLCQRPVLKEKGRRAWTEGYCARCWVKRKKMNRIVTNANLEQGRTPQVELLCLCCFHIWCACQAARKRWKVKGIRKGVYSTPRAVIVCKCNHHVGSALHVPSARGGRAAPNPTATLALCQLHARQLLCRMKRLQDVWLLFLGAAQPDPRYKSVLGHAPASWREKVAGHCLAAAKVGQMLEPDTAKRKFPHYRADTGSCLPGLAHTSLIVEC